MRSDAEIKKVILEELEKKRSYMRSYGQRPKSRIYRTLWIKNQRRKGVRFFAYGYILKSGAIEITNFGKLKRPKTINTIR